MQCCGKIFTSAWGLKRHNRLKHGPSPYLLYKCPVCGIAFSSKENYERHRLKQHAPITDLESLLKLKEQHIKTQCKFQKHVDIFNYELHGIDAKQIMAQVCDIFDKQTRAFKINLSFGFILRNIITNELRYFYSCQNNAQVLPKPILITKLADLSKFKEEMEMADILEYARQQRDNSQWVVEAIPNVSYYIYKLQNHPIGNEPNLPDFLLNNKALFALNKNYHGIPYKDNLCFFRCLALHNGFKTANLEDKTRELSKVYGKGVFLDKLHEVEQCFKVNIFVYSIFEDGNAELKRRSVSKHPTTMYLNLYGNHFSYISNIKRYTKTYICSKCEYVMRRAGNMIRHESTCKTEVRYGFPGGFYISKPSKAKFIPFIATYDIECMQVNNVHVLLSVSVCSNVSGFEKPMCFISEGDPGQLVEHFLVYLHKISDKASLLTGEPFELPVIGFNSGKYDLNVLRPYLFPLLEISHVIKRDNDYMSLKTPKLHFLDILHYLAPGYSYSQFLKAYDCQEQKGFFPYEWMDTLGKLDCPELPPIEAFYSKLKGKGISEEDYQVCMHAWGAQGMKTMRDFLIWYNNNDVVPFIEALEKMDTFYKERHLDMFRDAISVPGLTLKYLFATVDEGVFFSLTPGKNWEGVYQLIKRNIVGGPSIIFHRHHKAGETLINGKKMCQKVVGYDANSLYLWATMQEMPTGQMARRLEETGFKRSTAFGAKAYRWLSLVEKEQGIKIQHKFNDVEYRINYRPVDGFCKETNTVYQFHGCYYHGHRDCPIVGPKILNEKNNKTMDTLHQETIAWSRKITELGYNLVEMYECQFDREHPFQKRYPKLHDVPSIIRAINDDKIFGIVECDIGVPEHLKPHFAAFPPIFKNTDISIEDIGSHMKAHALKYGLMKRPRRSLISSYFGIKIALATPLLKWYLGHGLKVSRIYQVIEFTPVKCFERFGHEVTEARKAGDADPDKAIIADSMKLIGNSAYGKVLTNKEKFTEVSYSCDGINASHPRFKHAEEIAEDFYEIKKLPGKINADLPIQMGFFVYQYAKLRILQFYYDFLLKYVDQSDFQLCECDTDSFYIALTATTLEDLIKPQLREQFESVKRMWLVCDSGDKRTPGLFKVEWSGSEIIALCSKTYYCFGGDKDKFSCKGANRSQITNVNQYLDVIKNKQPGKLINKGFKLKANNMITYIQQKDALTYLYPKRIVLDDGVTTAPLEI